MCGVLGMIFSEYLQIQNQHDKKTKFFKYGLAEMRIYITK